MPLSVQNIKAAFKKGCACCLLGIAWSECVSPLFVQWNCCVRNTLILCWPRWDFTQRPCSLRTEAPQVRQQNTDQAPNAVQMFFVCLLTDYFLRVKHMFIWENDFSYFVAHKYMFSHFWDKECFRCSVCKVLSTGPTDFLDVTASADWSPRLCRLHDDCGLQTNFCCFFWFLVTVICLLTLARHHKLAS